MTSHRSHVAHHYDTTIFDYESTRLESQSPAEFYVTLRWLERHLPSQPGAAADIGVGVGHYAEFLARKGFSVHLVDVSSRLLKAASDRVSNCGLQRFISGVSQASATNLGCLDTESIDVLLMFGPLYHLTEAAERQRAISEAARVLRTGGILFAAGLNRLAYLRDLFREKPEQVVARHQFHQGFLQDGNLDPEHAPPIGYAHLTTLAEFQSLFADSFEKIAFVGTDSFATAWQATLASMSVEAREAWLDLIEETGRTIEGVSQSDHFLFVGKRCTRSQEAFA